MKTRVLFLLLSLAVMLPACRQKKQDTKQKLNPLSGTYEVVTDDSYVSFTSIKNHEIPVSGKFEQVSGSISIPKADSPEQSTGKFTLDLTSLDTGVDQRDQNILEFFFEAVGDNIVSKQATFELGPMKATRKLSSPVKLNKPFTLITNGKMSVHGKELDQKMNLTVTRTASNRIQVSTRKPYAFEIKAFEMTEPLNNMMDECDHGAISNAVPIQINLVLQKASGK